MSLTERIQIRVNSDELKKAREVAKLEGKTLSQLIREQIRFLAELHDTKDLVSKTPTKPSRSGRF